MKKQTAITALLAISIVALSAVSASAQVQAALNAEMQTGGLGSGLNSMVRNILGEQEAAQANSAAQTMMMTAPLPAALDMSAQSQPQATHARTMSLKAEVAADTLMVAALTEDDLHAYIQSLMEGDVGLLSVDTAETHVRVTYAADAKVFGIVPVMAKITVGAYASGETRVTYPWYAFATKRLSNEFKRSVQERIEPLITSESFTLEQQQILIDEMYLILSSEF